ncbi:MAG: parallel beta-helix domain-containing protein [Acidobacteriota bacterium]
MLSKAGVLKTAAGAMGWLAMALPAFTGETSGGELIVVTGTIQEAVDLALPGDTVFVPPGIYPESVLVDKSDLTLVGASAAVIDATGFQNGIQVGTGTITAQGGVPTCPPLALTNFTLRGLTIRNAEENGVFLIGVDGYRFIGGTYIDNHEYGPFPICSRNGLIERNFASGGNDAGIYVGDDDTVTVRRNVVTQYAIGVEIENSTHAVVEENILVGNTAGVLVVVLPGLPMAFTDDVRIERNLMIRNNLPNPVPADSGDPVGLIPTGTGLLNLGGDRVFIRRNVVVGNDSLGVAIVGNFNALEDSRIEPFVDQNEVRNNLVVGNGDNPDPERALTPGADITFIPHVIDPATGELLALDPDPTDNCFSDNRFVKEFPPDVTSRFSCPPDDGLIP